MKKIKMKGTSRSGGAGAMGGLGGGNNPAAMMAQLQKMQTDMMKAQEELESETVEISMGGGLVKVSMNGHQRIQELKIDKAQIDLEDEEWLEDLQELIKAAVNQAIEQTQASSAERMESITGGMGGGDMLRGLFG
jgi:DNA-binding YbaB/EbfC family protein